MADAITTMRDRMDALRGRLFQTIEALGLPSKQESAVKGLIRSTSYEVQAELERAIRQEQQVRSESR